MKKFTAMVLFLLIKGSYVLKGHFLLRDNLMDMTYKLKPQKVYSVYPGTVHYVFSDPIKKGRGAIKYSIDVHAKT